MKRSILIVAFVLCLGLLLMGCDKGQEVPTSEEILFSNLVEESVQEEVAGLMDRAGISKTRQDVFFNHVDQFNDTVSRKSLTNEYEVAGILDLKYDPYDMQDEWMKEYPYFLGYNCRITAFGLYGDFMNIPLGGEVRDSAILMDLSTLEEDSAAVSVVKGDLERFKILYSTIPTEETKDIAFHVNKVQEDWENRGIGFLENETASLITVWFHDQIEEDYLFIGHVGVLFETEGGLYFVEKLAFQEPYQVTKFSIREELNNYMMTKYDISEDQPTAAPFIMENDQLMVGYSQ